MLNPVQNHLVRELVKEKIHNLNQVIRQENAKPLLDQNLKQIDDLQIQLNEYQAIHEEMIRVSC